MISKSEVKKLAELARIDVHDKELEGLTKDLEKILEYVSQLEKFSVDMDTGNIPMLSDNRNVMREDGIGHESCLYTKDLLDSAPRTDGPFIKVDKVIDN